MPVRPFVLCVEDDTFVRNALVMMIKALDCEVVAAETAEQALALVRKGFARVDILVADIILPLIDGIQLFQELRETRPTMEVMFISGYPKESLIALRALPAGTPYLQKPFGFDGLEACLLPLIHDTLN